MKLLVKFPSRERPIQFFRIMQACLDLSTDPNTKYLISLDLNDPKLQQYLDLPIMKDERLTVIKGYSKGKIHAVNRDMDKVKDWDIVVVVSDDQVPIRKGWDSKIIEEMNSKYPDTDGVLFFSDGHTKLNTQCILGKKYYERFGFIYDPKYLSLWSDNAFQNIADMLGKQTRYEEVLFEHKHYSTDKNIRPDTLMKRTQAYYRQDERTYKKHEKENFGLIKTIAGWETSK